MKKQNGITLIALIITIVVLLILAVVAINSVKDGGIIQHAQDAAETYNTKADEENQILQDYADFITDKTTEKIDYEAIAQIYNNLVSGNITEVEMLQQLKEEKAIGDNNEMLPIVNTEGEMYVYFYKIDALYKMNTETFSISYVENEGYEEEINFGKNIVILKVELERILKGKPVSEILEKFNTGKLIEYVLEESDIITAIDEGRKYPTSNDLQFYNITFISGDNEITFGYDNGYSIAIECNDQVYDNISIFYGT